MTEDENKALISVIVPVYQAECYLGRCIESVLHQTYSNLELILIDDGSRDASGRICDEYAEKDKRIRVIHRKNSGVAVTRNCGLAEARGKYISFVDADDLVLPEMLEKLYSLMINVSADISVCDKWAFEGEPPAAVQQEPEKTCMITGLEAMKSIYGNDGMTYAVVWGKLYRRELLDRVHFSSRRINEDEEIMYHLFEAAENVAVVNQKYYLYFRNVDSLTHADGYLRSTDIFDVLDTSIAYYREKKYDEVRRAAEKACLNRIINRCRMLQEGSVQDREYCKVLQERYRREFKEYGVDVPGIGYRLFCFSQGIYFCILKIKQHSGGAN